MARVLQRLLVLRTGAVLSRALRRPEVRRGDSAAIRQDWRFGKISDSARLKIICSGKPWRSSDGSELSGIVKLCKSARLCRPERVSVSSIAPTILFFSAGRANRARWLGRILGRDSMKKLFWLMA